MKPTVLVACIVLALCAALRADAPASQPVSKPVEKNGLQVTVTLAKAVFAADEPLAFAVQFKDVSEKACFSLYNAKYFWQWKAQCVDQRGGPWQVQETFVGFRSPVPTIDELGPGQKLEVPVTIDTKFYQYKWLGQQEKPIRPVRQLPAGKYRLTVEITLDQNAEPIARAAFPYWTGTITAEPLEFEVSNKPVGTQPASAPAPGEQVAEAQARELATVIAARQGWGQPTGIEKVRESYWVHFDTPDQERMLLGPRTVVVNAVTGKCRIQPRE